MANWWLVVFCFQLANVAKALHKVPKNISFQKKVPNNIFAKLQQYSTTSSNCCSALHLLACLFKAREAAIPPHDLGWQSKARS